jgi:mono/diheme cytochrome c family protein
LRARLGAFAVLVSIVLAACSSGDGSTPVPDDGGPPFDGKPVGDFYRANCSSCHGTDRGGGIGPALTPERLTREDAVYFDAIARGRPGTSMPVWRNRGLTDQEITALVEYLRTEP